VEIRLGVFFFLFFHFILVLGELLRLGGLIRNKSKIKSKLDPHNKAGNCSGLFHLFFLQFGMNWGYVFVEFLFTVHSCDSCFP